MDTKEDGFGGVSVIGYRDEKTNKIVYYDHPIYASGKRVRNDDPPKESDKP
jgi:hypothetical protein